jgi:hypothetical protein
VDEKLKVESRKQKLKRAMKRHGRLVMAGVMVLLAMAGPTQAGHVRGYIQSTVGDGYKVNPVFRPVTDYFPQLTTGQTNVVLPVTKTALTDSAGYFALSNLVGGLYDVHFGDLAVVRVLMPPNTNATYWLGDLAALATNDYVFTFTNTVSTVPGLISRFVRPGTNVVFMTNGPGSSTEYLTVHATGTGTGGGTTIVNTVITTNGTVLSTNQYQRIESYPYQTRRQVNANRPLFGVMGWYYGNTNDVDSNGLLSYSNRNSLFWLTNTMRIAEQNGWKGLGANFIWLDDMCLWRTNGVIEGIGWKWPGGMSNAMWQARQRGFEVGHYAEPHYTTSAGTGPGSLGYLETDAATFASWGTRAIKFDMYASTNVDLHLAQFSKALDDAGWQGHLHIGLGLNAWVPRYGAFVESWRSAIWPTPGYYGGIADPWSAHPAGGGVDVTTPSIEGTKRMYYANFANMMRFQSDMGRGRSPNLDSLPVWYANQSGGSNCLELLLTMWSMTGNGLVMHQLLESWHPQYAVAFSRISLARDIFMHPASARLIQSSNVPAYPPHWGPHGGWEVWRKDMDSGLASVGVINRDTNNAAPVKIDWALMGWIEGEPVQWSNVFRQTNAVLTNMIIVEPAFGGSLWTAIPTRLIVTNSSSSGTATNLGVIDSSGTIVLTSTNAPTWGAGSPSLVLTNPAATNVLVIGFQTNATGFFKWTGLQFWRGQSPGDWAQEWANVFGDANETAIQVPAVNASDADPARARRITFRDSGSSAILATLNTNGVLYANGGGVTNVPFATNAVNSTNFWGLLNNTNLPTISRPLGVLALPTNAMASMVVDMSKSTVTTNLGGNVTISGVSWVSSTNYESTVIWLLPNGADRTVTLPASFLTPTGAGTFTVSNTNTLGVTLLTVGGIQGFRTNATWQHYAR